jgi:hypothetical protein
LLIDVQRLSSIGVLDRPIRVIFSSIIGDGDHDGSSNSAEPGHQGTGPEVHAMVRHQRQRVDHAIRAYKVEEDVSQKADVSNAAATIGAAHPVGIATHR